MHRLIIILFLLFTVNVVSAETFKRPMDQNGKTTINFYVVIVDIDDISSSDQTFTANVFISYSWKDKSLSHSGKAPMIKPLNSVWNPNILIANCQKLYDTIEKVVEIQADGTVTYKRRVWGKFSQPLHLEGFPFDTQKFILQFNAPEYSYDELVIKQSKVYPSIIADVLSLPNWSVVSYESESTYYQPVEYWAKIPALNFEFKAKRHTGYYWFKILLPLFLIIFMSWIVFWIDPTESAIQISIAITSMLTLIAYRFAIGESLPNISYMTSMDFFILGSTIMVFAGLIEVVYTSTLAYKGKLQQAKLVDKWCRCIFVVIFIALLLGLIF
jgi:hypothetical protein